MLAFCLAAAPALAEVELGDNAKMTMNGTLGMGYAGELGTYNTGSSHGLFLQGMGTLSGSYYNANFLSFTLQPYYNRNQDNSSFQSIFSDTGVNATVSFFSGSHFPGSVSYGRAFTNGSEYGLPGNLGLNANGSTQTFAVTWSAFIPNLPTLTATFSDSSSSDTILGETGTTSTRVRSLSLISNYKLHGFGLSGIFNHQNFNTTFPAFLTGSTLESDSGNTTYGITATHSLPLSGSFAVGFTRSSYGSETASVLNNSTSDMLYGTVGLSPTQKLTVNGSVRYNDNVIGALQQSVLPTGTAPLFWHNLGSNGISLNAFASYNIGHNFILTGYANRQMQHFAGSDYTLSQYGATLTYSYARPLLGMLYFSFGTVDTTGNGNQGTLAFVGTLGLKKQLRGWDINADVSYSQSVQNSIALFTTSNYNYGGFVRKRIGSFTYWSASARSVQSGLTQFGGYSNRSETFLTTLTRGRVGVSGSYSMSHGTSILTTSGVLTPTPLAPLLSSSEVLYNGRAYGVGFNVIPLRRMVVNVNWLRTFSDTQTAVLFSNNDSSRIYGQLNYNLRKLQLRASYWKVNQLISSSGIPRTTQNSYSFTVSRWFNLF